MASDGHRIKPSLPPARFHFRPNAPSIVCVTRAQREEMSDRYYMEASGLEPEPANEGATPACRRLPSSPLARPTANGAASLHKPCE